MTTSLTFANAWDVFLLFTIPIGGGIPGGVILGHQRGLTWPMMMSLYFVSDLALAAALEPILMLLKLAGKRIQFLGRVHEAMKLSLKTMTARYGVSPSPLTLILISFGVDPMTGRAAALFAGHGFIMGWTVAIIGDLIYFALIMASTLWLNGILGDGTWTTVIIMAVMFLAPPLVRRLRGVQ